jgi:hypothetical protein
MMSHPNEVGLTNLVDDRAVDQRRCVARPGLPPVLGAHAHAHVARCARRHLKRDVCVAAVRSPGVRAGGEGRHGAPGQERRVGKSRRSRAVMCLKQAHRLLQTGPHWGDPVPRASRGHDSGHSHASQHHVCDRQLRLELDTPGEPRAQSDTLDHDHELLNQKNRTCTVRCTPRVSWKKGGHRTVTREARIGKVTLAPCGHPTSTSSRRFPWPRKRSWLPKLSPKLRGCMHCDDGGPRLEPDPCLSSFGLSTRGALHCPAGPPVSHAFSELITTLSLPSALGVVSRCLRSALSLRFYRLRGIYPPALGPSARCAVVVC